MIENRPKVAFLIRSLAYGGAQRQLIILAAGLRSAGWDVSVLAFYPGPLDADLRATGAAVVELRKRSRWDVVGLFVRLIRALRTIRPDILHTYMTMENVLGVAVKFLSPKLRLVWGIRATDFESGAYGRLYRVGVALERLTSRIPDQIIANSYAGAESLRRSSYATAKVIVIHNGIDLERFRPDVRLRETTRSAWQIPPGMKVIGSVARFDPMKGYELLIDAASLLLHERSDVKFVWLGDSSRPGYIAELQRLAERKGIHNAVRWEQSRADLVGVYNAFDVMTLVSRYGEGFSNAVGEAMACGVPCTVSDVGDNALIVGDTGFVVKSDAASIMSAWRAALAAPLEKLGAQARERIARNYSRARFVQETNDSLRSVMA